jgi:hypothetical protein
MREPYTVYTSTSALHYSKCTQLIAAHTVHAVALLYASSYWYHPLLILADISIIHLIQDVNTFSLCMLVYAYAAVRM